MTAKVRSHLKSAMWDIDYIPYFKNVLVNGCSFTFNNSDTDCCTWPYYLAETVGLDFNQVYDCSQSGAGSNHVLYSTINEIETNKNLSPEFTLVIVMWSGLARVDVIGKQDITKKWHTMSNYHFDDKLATLSLFRERGTEKTNIEKLCKLYFDIVGPTEQIYQSCLNIIALKNYLENKNFKFVFTSWQNSDLELSMVDNQLSNQVKSLLNNNLIFLGDWATEKDMLIPNDGHPNSEAHVHWTRQQLIPSLINQKLINFKDQKK
jgi:hypothetical protein